MYKQAISKAHIKGFTLLELLVVLLIAGIISGFAYPSYVTMIRLKVIEDAKNDTRQVMQNLDRSFSFNKHYTISYTDLKYGSTIQLAGGKSGHEQYRLVLDDCSPSGATLVTCTEIRAEPRTGFTQIPIISTRTNNRVFTCTGPNSSAC